MPVTNVHRQILALTDEELERFVREWAIGKQPQYAEITDFGGAGDLGRDVVGFLSSSRHEGPWHNYQCKQYGKPLPTAVGLLEIGKILYFAHQGHFSAPHRYTFVAPRGVNRNLESLIFKPSTFQQRLISEWPQYCENEIRADARTPLDAGLLGFIKQYDFSRISRTNLADMLLEPHVTAVLHRWFGVDPGPPPRGMVPEGVQDIELPYIRQLLDAYGERARETYADHAALVAHPSHGPHLILQRERFYDADAFKRFYRDNTDTEVLEAFEDDIYHGVIDTCIRDHVDALARVDAVMEQAASIQAAGPLAQYARVRVKQGVCHHFANAATPRLRWRP